MSNLQGRGGLQVQLPISISAWVSLRTGTAAPPPTSSSAVAALSRTRVAAAWSSRKEPLPISWELSGQPLCPLPAWAVSFKGGLPVVRGDPVGPPFWGPEWAGYNTGLFRERVQTQIMDAFNQEAAHSKLGQC